MIGRCGRYRDGVSDDRGDGPIFPMVGISTSNRSMFTLSELTAETTHSLKKTNNYGDVIF